MTYLINDLCKFTPLFDIDFNKKVNIFSACFFKLKNKGYKDFSKYLDGLKNFNKQISIRKLPFKIRLFIDESIFTDKELYTIISKLENVQPVLYSCPNFTVKDKYHIGLFGTLVRFFPFFDFPNNDADVVISSDIDYTNISSIMSDINLLKKYNILDKIYLMKSGNLTRSLRYKFDFIYKNKLNPYVFALSFVSVKRIDNNVLVDYLKTVNSDRENKNYSYHYISELDTKSDEIKNKYSDEYGSFIYGVDEYFLNSVLTQYVIDKKLCYVVRTSWDVFGCLYYLITDLNVLTGKQINLLNLIFQYVYKELGIKIPDSGIEDKFKKLDEIIYSSNEKNEDKKYEIYRVFYKMFLYLKSNPNYKFIFPNGFYDLFVDNEYFGVYNIDFFRIINCEKKDRDIIIEKNSLKNKDIDKLKNFYSKYK